MRLPQMRWPIIIVVFALCLAVLSLSYWLWQRGTVQQPLLANVSQVPGVEETALRSLAGVRQLTITVNADIEFAPIATKVAKLMRASAPKIEVVWLDQRSDSLAVARASLDLILREAQIRHEYVLMADRVRTKLSASGIEHELAVDEHAIYLKLQQGQQLWLETLPVILPGGAGE